MKFKINKNFIGSNERVYFIADVAANHDGSLKRALKLIELAKDAGANAAKFQHHDVKKYVSDYGFKSLGKKMSHQSNWKKSIFNIYKDAQVPVEWTIALKKKCQEVGIDFFSTPYDLDMVDFLNPYVKAFKVGSGDLAWDDMIKKVCKKNKPIFIATGASNLKEVKRAYNIANKINKKLCIMQCNTNYTASKNNFNYINLSVINLYKKIFPNAVIGLSDHTHGHETVLGAVALGARVIEKHFTDDNFREGPDHPFSMNPKTWKIMVDSCRLLEKSIGDGIKKVEKNELQTVILQRRAVRAIKNLKKGSILKKNDFEYQRPCPKDSIKPNEIKKFIGKKINKNIQSGECLKSFFFN